jgi:hypothetical protein
MSRNLMDEEWVVLMSLLPSGWQELAREMGAMRRARGEITSAEVLLQLLLLHVATGLSLQQATARARLQGLTSVTDVALLKRLRSSEQWLCEMGRRMFTGTRFVRGEVSAPKGRRLRAVDATTIEEPGATGTDWRVHYSLSLPDLHCDFFELTDAGGAETYKRLAVKPGDIILADRGYCHREGVAHVLGCGGDVIVRLNSTSFPLLNVTDESPFAMLPRLRQLPGFQPGEWSVRFKAAGHTWNARLCALRKAKAAAELAKKKILQEANKKQKQLLPDTLEFAEYVFVLATLPCDMLDAANVLQLYRARWQIELCFKRMKSLFKLGHLPKRSDASARAWIQGKLLTVLLIERLIDEARLFSPWGFKLSPTEPVAGVY